MIACCGANRETSFCPECGKRLLQPPLKALLAYLRGRHREAYRLVKAYDEYQEQNQSSPRSPMVQERYDKFKADADKWQSWIDAIEAKP